ncbi:MAG: restriction endonuclease [Steroidobacteraceae bacterium]
MSILLLASAGAAVTAEAQSGAPVPEKPSVIIISVARLIDGRGGEPLAPAMVRVDGDKITAIGTSLQVPAGARRIDLGDSTLLPGFIDLHTHLTGRSDVHWEDALVKGDAARQCKAHNKRVPIGTMRELSASLVDFKANDAILACFEGVTKPVIEYIKGKNIRVLSVHDIVELQRKHGRYPVRSRQCLVSSNSNSHLSHSRHGKTQTRIA